MDAYRVGEKLEYDVLPSLDGDRRELESRLNVYENAQMNYRKEHFCTHEDAMKTSDGIYAQNERNIQKIKEESLHVVPMDIQQEGIHLFQSGNMQIR